MMWPFKWKLSLYFHMMLFISQNFREWNLEIWSKFAFGHVWQWNVIRQIAVLILDHVCKWLKRNTKVIFTAMRGLQTSYSCGWWTQAPMVSGSTPAQHSFGLQSLWFQHFPNFWKNEIFYNLNLVILTTKTAISPIFRNFWRNRSFCWAPFNLLHVYNLNLVILAAKTAISPVLFLQFLEKSQKSQFWLGTLLPSLVFTTCQ